MILVVQRPLIADRLSPNRQTRTNRAPLSRRKDLRSAAGCLGLTTLSLFGLGCTSSSEGLPEAEVVDSAGLRLVSYDLTDVDVPVYRVIGEHDLEIGQLNGPSEYALSRIVDLATLQDGSFAVSDEATQAVRLYRSDGSYVSTIGRAGEGPGEFVSAPLIAGTSADTVFAFDNRNDRLTALTADGDLVRTISLRNESVGRPTAMLRLDDGSYLSQSRWTDPGAEDEFYDVRLELDSAVVERLSALGALLDTVQVMPDRDRARTVMDGGGGRFRVLEFQPPFRAHAVLKSDGANTILGRSNVFQFEFRDAGPQTILRVLGVQNPATAQEISVWQEATLREEFGDRPVPPGLLRGNLDFLPERLPAFGNVLVSAEGNLWVSLTEFDLSEGLDWLVFSSDGGIRGTVRTPPELRLREVGSDFVVGFVLDDLDVPYVRRYPLLETALADPE